MVQETRRARRFMRGFGLSLTPDETSAWSARCDATMPTRRSLRTDIVARLLSCARVCCDEAAGVRGFLGGAAVWPLAAHGKGPAISVGSVFYGTALQCTGTQLQPSATGYVN